VPVIQQEQTKPCEVSLDIEVEADVVIKAFDEAYTELGKHASVPGFRKGKAPKSLLKQYLSEERVKEHAAETLVHNAYEKAIEEAGLDPFGAAEYEVVHLEEAEPFKFKAKVPLAPKIELGEYVGIEVERLTPVVSDEDIQKEIDEIRERMAKVESIDDRPVQVGDLAIISVTEPNGEARETVVEAGKNLDSFDAGLLGMNKDESKAIELSYPKDHEDADLAGTKTIVTVKVNDIKSRSVPEMTDELVLEISEKSDEKITTVEELRQKIRTAMEKAAVDLADRKTESAIVDKIVGNAEINFPDTVLEHEVEHRFEDLLAQLDSRKMNLEQYLEGTSQTFEQLRSHIEEAAQRDLRVNLVLFEIATKEKLEVSDEDVEAELQDMAKEAGVPIESVRAYVDKTGGKKSIENRLLYRKVLDFLVKASNIKNKGRDAS
jgi:trigger factor